MHTESQYRTFDSRRPEPQTHPIHDARVADLYFHADIAKAAATRKSERRAFPPSDRGRDATARPEAATSLLRTIGAGDRAPISHPGFGLYLYRCWQNDLGAVLRPDVLWHTVCMEISRRVLSDPEAYAHLFRAREDVDGVGAHEEGTDGRGAGPGGEGKEALVIEQPDADDIDIRALDDALSARIANRAFKRLIVDTTFTTAGGDDDLFRLVQRMTFAHAARPYFDYHLLSCGIPRVRVEGTRADWMLLYDSVVSLRGFAPDRWGGYLDEVAGIVAQIYACAFLEGVPGGDRFFSNMFWIKDRCGSGHPYKVRGWATRLFMRNINVVEDVPPHAPLVPYRNASTGRRFYKCGGLFFSETDADNRFLVPSYGAFVYEVGDPELFDRI